MVGLGFNGLVKRFKKQGYALVGNVLRVVLKNGYFLPPGNEIPTFLNLSLDFSLKLLLFKYHG
jgi:hypothetical protein